MIDTGRNNYIRKVNSMIFPIKSLTDRYNSVAIVGVTVGLSSIFFGWLTVKSNRLATGTSLYLWDSLGWGPAVAIIALWTGCLVFCILNRKTMFLILLGSLANLILIVNFVLAGVNATDIINKSPEFTRVSLSTGMFISSTGAIILIVAVRQQLVNFHLAVSLISWTWLLILIIFLAVGWFNNISVIQEYLNNTARFQQELITHLYLFGISIFVGIIIGIPLGIWAARSRVANRPIFFLTSITQTIPSLALFGLLIAPLSALSSSFPLLRQIGVAGIGAAPAIIALIIYSLLPIMENTYTGLHQIDPSIINAGKGMGMNRIQLLCKVEAPLAIPVILQGVRTAAVQTIGNTAVAALIGAGGLGQFIFQGLGQAASDLIILGALPIIILALLIDIVMQTVIRLATPRGMVRSIA